MKELSFGNAILFYYCCTFVQVSTFLSEAKEEGSSSVLLSLVPPFCLERSEYDDFPFVYSTLYKEEYSQLPAATLTTIGKNLRFNLTQADVEKIEKMTQLQRESTAWKKYRVGRITASVCREVCHVKAADSNISLIRKICYSSDVQLRTKPILWGCRHERDALASYLRINSKNHRRLQVLNITFVVSSVVYLVAMH